MKTGYFGMRTTDEDRQKLAAVRARLGLRSEAEAVRSAVDVLDAVLTALEHSAAGWEAVVRLLLQGDDAAILTLAAFMEAHPSMYLQERDRVLEMAKSIRENRGC
jgi:hypothetical protein